MENHFLRDSFSYLYEFLLGNANELATIWHYMVSIGIIVFLLSSIFLVASLLSSKKMHYMDLDEKLTSKYEKKQNKRK